MTNPTCPLCHATSTACLVGRPDHEYGVPARVDYHRCAGCRSVFVDPLPSPDEISSFYAAYSTHGAAADHPEGRLARWARRMSQREFEAAAPASRDLPVLDYGCGDGAFLRRLLSTGHRQAVGYDFDPAARAAARGSGAAVVDDVEELAEHGPYGTITLNHVIEHLADPAESLARLGELLVPGGRLVLRTPNARSVLSRVFRDSWRGWETPRHLHIFTPAGMRALADDPQLKGLRLRHLGTSEAMYLGIFHESLHGARWQRPVGKLLRHALALVSWGALSVATRVRPVGEELVVVLERG